MIWASLIPQLVKKICLQRRRPRFNSWVGKIPWKGEWLPTPQFLPGECHGQRSLAGYSPWDHRVRHNWATSTSTSVLPMNIQGLFPLRLNGLISLLSKGLSRVLSSATVRKHQFFGAQHSLWSNSHIHTWLLEKPWLWIDGPLLAKWCLCFLICCLGGS